MRIYGEIVDLKQRFYESIIFAMLSERRVGPRSYGVFYSGRLEQYYPVRPFFYLWNSRQKINCKIIFDSFDYWWPVFFINQTNVVDQKFSFWPREIYFDWNRLFYLSWIISYSQYKTVVTQQLKISSFQKSIGKKLAEFHCMRIPLNRESNFIWENTEK